MRHGAKWPTVAARLQGILAIREQHLERAKFHALFIESRIAKGPRTVQTISEPASICFNAALWTAHADTDEKLNTLRAGRERRPRRPARPRPGAGSLLLPRRAAPSLDAASASHNAR